MIKTKIGIDIGTKTIKAVELVRKKQGFFLSAVGEMPLPESFISLLTDKNKKMLSVCINKLLADAKMTSKNIVSSLPSGDVFISIINMPMMPREELDYAMKWQLTKIVPGYPNDKNAFWDILLADRDYRILVVGVDNIKLKKFMDVYKANKLNPISIEIEAVSLARVAFSDEESGVIIHFGSSHTSCILVDNGILSLVRTIKVGEEELIKSIVDDGNSYDKAKAMLYEYGLFKFKSKGNIYKNVSPLVNQIIAEVKRMIGYFEESHGRELKKVAVSGGGAYLPDVINHFIQEFSKDVSLVNPWAKISCPPSMDSQGLVSIGPRFAVACGLAMYDV